MFLNMDQLQKQLDNNEFQEIGSMASFKVLETQFQMFIKSKIYLNDEYIVMTRNYFLEYTRLDIPEFRDTLIQNMDYVKKSIEKRALHKMEYDSRVNERLMQTTEEKVDSSKALDASLDSASADMLERIRELERDNRRLRDMMDVASQRVSLSQRRELRVQREMRQIRRFRFYDRKKIARLEAYARRHLGYRS
ncbi:hypothetical protein Tco_0758985 [Tanacetum coccineum]